MPRRRTQTGSSPLAVAFVEKNLDKIRKVVTYLIARSPSKHNLDVDDIFQDTCYQILLSKQFAEGTVENENSFLHRIVANLIRDSFKRKDRSNLRNIPEKELKQARAPEPRDMKAVDEDFYAMLKRARQRLTPEQFEVLALQYQGIQTKEIARRLGISPKTVGTRQFRTREAMKPGSPLPSRRKRRK